MEEIVITTKNKYEIVDITTNVAKAILSLNGGDGVCIVYVKHSTCAITINENYDPNIGLDLLNALDKLIPEDGWMHNKIDNNGAAHMKSAIIGPSEVVPIKEGKLQLGRWQKIVMCDFDGPRERKILINIC